jgi:hypothetical protein
MLDVQLLRLGASAGGCLSSGGPVRRRRPVIPSVDLPSVLGFNALVIREFKGVSWLCLLLGIWLAAGCQSGANKLWSGRVGTYSMDEAIKELGPADRQATTTDGVTVAQWLVARSRVYSRNPGFASWGMFNSDISSTPELYLQLTFGKDGRLASWKKVMK